MLLLKCGAISELYYPACKAYMILRVYFGRKCINLFITPNVRDTSFGATIDRTIGRGMLRLIVLSIVAPHD